MPDAGLPVSCPKFERLGMFHKEYYDLDWLWRQQKQSFITSTGMDAVTDIACGKAEAWVLTAKERRASRMIGTKGRNWVLSGGRGCEVCTTWCTLAIVGRVPMFTHATGPVSKVRAVVGRCECRDSDSERAVVCLAPV